MQTRARRRLHPLIVLALLAVFFAGGFLLLALIPRSNPMRVSVLHVRSIITNNFQLETVTVQFSQRRTMPPYVIDDLKVETKVNGKWEATFQDEPYLMMATNPQTAEIIVPGNSSECRLTFTYRESGAPYYRAARAATRRVGRRGRFRSEVLWHLSSLFPRKMDTRTASRVLKLPLPAPLP